MISKRRTGLLLFILFAAFISLTACQATMKASKGDGSYELKRSLILPNHWEVFIKKDVKPVYDAVLAGVNDLDLKIYIKQVDRLSAIVEGSFADATEYTVKLSYEAPSVTLMRIRVGMTGNKGRTMQLFQSIEKHL